MLSVQEPADVPQSPRARIAWRFDRPFRIGAALLLLVLAVGIRLVLDPWLGEALSYPTVLTAVLLATWYCGVGPALLIAAIGYPAVEFLIHANSFASRAPEYLVPSFALYAGLTWVIVFFVGTFRREHDELSAIQQTLRRSEQRIRACFDHAAVGIVELDVEDRFVALNDEMCRILAYPGRELIGRCIQDVTAPEDQVRTYELIQQVRAGELERVDFEVRLVRREGSLIWVHTTLSAIRDTDGRPHHYIATVDDISKRKASAAAFEQTREQFEQLVNHIPEAFWITDLDRRAVVYVSPAFERIHGAALPSTRPARAFKAMLHPEDRERVLEAHRNMAAGPVDVQYRIRRPDGTVRWVHARGYPFENADNVVYRVAGTIEDITERRELEERLQYQAHFDSLTGLPNRILFFDRLAQALSHAQRAAHSLGLLYVDIDHFKTVNDTLGHDMGDKLLSYTADRLVRAVRAEDTVARLGGDEFAIILPHVDRPEHAAGIAEKTLRTLSESANIEGHEITMRASVGVAISPPDGINAQTLLKNADAAMFRAKESGRNRYAFYTAQMNARAAAQRDLQNRLSRALEGDEFALHFQAKANIRNGRLTGCEALLRWIDAAPHPTGPSTFVPILEECGLIMPVGEWVIRTACRQIAQWKRAGLTPLPVAINVSARQFHQGDIAAVIEQALSENGLDSSLLEIELTESAAMQNTEETIDALTKIKALGIKIAIDDFGTGYSSLSYLTRLPLDVLKIDRSFVTGLPDNRNDASIARAIITMAHSLGLNVIAEGVEHERQLDFLAQNDCDEVQGYLLSRPLTAGDLAGVLRAADGRSHATTH